IGPDYGNYYANWVTMKVAPSGVRLWTRTFDALSDNNEIPEFVALDPLDNVYVTGVGGPEVILANGSSYMRMVTLKYTAGGDPVWTIGSVDGGQGNAVRVGSDASTLYVQGYSQMYTARYRQTGLADASAATAAAPAAPTNLGATTLSSSQILLQWTNNSSTQTGISIERCASPCRNFGEIARVAGSAASFTDGGLASRKSYSYRVRAYNDIGWSPYSASVTAKTLR
ncbi:MAG: fibronectin type III domain-containing protein, partial [Burkholderiales bacterium]